MNYLKSKLTGKLYNDQYLEIPQDIGNPLYVEYQNNVANGSEVFELDSVSNEYNPADTTLFLHNNKPFLDEFVDFSEWVNYQLTGFADIDIRGDKSKIIWKNELGQVCIEETPVYTRSVVGSGLLASFNLERTLTIKYYKIGGSFKEVQMPIKHYSNKERIEADKKSRNNLIERVREQTGNFIYQKNVVAGTPHLIELELLAALSLFKILSPELQAYREDREHAPIVAALQAIVPVLPMTQATINFIKLGVDVNYYPQ